MTNEAQRNEDTVEPLVRQASHEAKREGVGFGYRYVMLRQLEHERNGRYAPAQECAAIRHAMETVPLVGCSHDWKEPVDSQFSNDTRTEVKCTKCDMVGEKTIATGEVFFPAT